MFYRKSISATAYIYKDGKVLLHMHKKYKKWFPVGGHVEENEFPHEAVIRECREETGLDVKVKSCEFMQKTNLGTVERIPLPFCTCREGIGSDEEFYDFIFIAYTGKDRFCPQAGESQKIKWFTEREIKQCRNIEKHVKNIAISIIKQEKMAKSKFLSENLK